jgi:hypothetical protein
MENVLRCWVNFVEIAILLATLHISMRLRCMGSDRTPQRISSLLSPNGPNYRKGLQHSPKGIMGEENALQYQ